MTQIFDEVTALCTAAKHAGAALAASSGAQRNRALISMRDALIAHTADILTANETDMLHAA